MWTDVEINCWKVLNALLKVFKTQMNQQLQPEIFCFASLMAEACVESSLSLGFH